MKILRYILFPFSILYGLLMWIRNQLYNWGIIKQTSFDIPIICVGNLSTGGTGKTPHVEYLIRLLRNNFRLATLSRGYGRKTKGFVLATQADDSYAIGDESKQYLSKFDTVSVAVCESRVAGVRKLLNLIFDLECIVLDDGFQHRSMKPGLSILLTDYYSLYANDFVLPTGNLREFRMGAHRANIIVVTKTPKVLSPITCRSIEEQLKISPNQKLYFSYLKYGLPVPLTDAAIDKPIDNVSSILLFAGIANVYPLEAHLKHQSNEVIVMKFSDHHDFTKEDIGKVKSTFLNIYTKNKVLMTTEKDYMRLQASKLIEILNDVPLYFVPVQVEFHKENKDKFNKQILEYVSKN
ncbi:MAG: tetraacyldisaccharide 4'-kinase [Bacteroidota bacterium]